MTMTIARVCRPGVLVVTIPAAFMASAPAAQVQITIDKSSFSPKRLTVKPSDFVNWIHRDNITDTGN
jgi:plastocyanin